MKDVQNDVPKYQYDIPLVGIEKLKAYVPIHWHNNSYHLLCTFNVFVNLPAKQKGIHMSRIPESIYDVVRKTINTTHTSLEELLVHIKDKLLEKHDYANTVVIKTSTFLPITVKTPKTNKDSQEIIPVKMILEHKDNSTMKTLIVHALGQTVCPCAQELTREELNIELAPSHNQRGQMTIEFKCPIDYNITFEELYDIACQSMSAPTYSLLKRPDEKHVVLQAHSRPRFVEDCVRYAKHAIEQLIKNKSKDKGKNKIRYRIKQVNYESIHKHNAIAIIGDLNDFNF